jgi:hypothetical protein
VVLRPSDPFNLGFFAMIAYLIVGPDTAEAVPQTATARAVA